MDCACEDGIPGSEFADGKGLSWLNIRLRVTERRAFNTDPIAIHIDSASCLQRITAPNKKDTNHLLCSNIKKDTISCENYLV